MGYVHRLSDQHTAKTIDGKKWKFNWVNEIRIANFPTSGTIFVLIHCDFHIYYT